MISICSLIEIDGEVKPLTPELAANAQKIAEENNAEIIALSTLMTTAMPSMQEVVELLEKQEKRDKYKVLIGGGPISPNFAKKIRADAYASTAAEAARIAKEFAAAEEAARQTA